jgi:hypothetical protein
MRVGSLNGTLRGKIKTWRDTERRQSKRFKDLGDIARFRQTLHHDPIGEKGVFLFPSPHHPAGDPGKKEKTQPVSDSRFG